MANESPRRRLPNDPGAGPFWKPAVVTARWYRDFLQDLAHLLKSGIALLEALDGVADEQQGKRSAVARRLAQRVRSGWTLGEAMAGSPGIPREHAALAEAGEQSGTLDRVLSKIVERLDRDREMAVQLASRVAYPIAIIVLAVVLLPLYLLVSEGLYAYLAIQLLFFGAVAGIAILCWLTLRLLGRSEATRTSFETMVLAVPWFGPLIADGSVGKAFGLLGLLAGAGLPLGKSFELVARTARWSFLSGAFRSLERRLMEGKTLAQALALDRFFRTRSGWLARITVAEKAGALEKAFLELGDQLEASARSRIGLLFRILPMLLLPLVGAFVLWRILSVHSIFHV